MVLSDVQPLTLEQAVVHALRLQVFYTGKRSLYLSLKDVRLCIAYMRLTHSYLLMPSFHVQLSCSGAVTLRGQPPCQSAGVFEHGQVLWL